MLKKGCAIAFALFAVVFGGYYALLRGRVEFPADLVLALMGSIGLLILVSSLKQCVFGSGDVGVLKRAEQGLSLEDGRKEAVWGPIEPLGAPLVAPFSGRPCVAYEYDAKKPDGVDSEGDRSPGGSAISGLALVPSVIRSGRGDVRLLGFSLLEKFASRDVSREPGALERARGYADSASFSQMGLMKIGSLLSQMDDALTDDDGAVRKDFRFEDPARLHLDACALTEKVIAPGDTVTAVGIWDASRGGLVPKHRGASSVVTLTPGGGAAMVEYAKKRPWGLLLFALVWSGGIHAFIYFALTRPH